MLASEESAEQALTIEEALLEDDKLALSGEPVETLTPEAELSFNEASPEELPSDLVTDVIDTLERLPEPVVFPDEQQIADYWLDAFWLPRNVEGVREYKPLVTITPAKTCRTEKPWLAFENNQWVRHTPNHFIPLPEYLAVVPEGVDWERHPGAHILSSESFELESLSRQIRQQRSLTRLLHTTWRQPVAFGENNAFKVRLLGGHDLGLQFNLNGEPHPKRPQITTGIFMNNDASEGLAEVIENSGEITSIENPTIFDRISDRLSSPEPVSLRDLMQGTAANETEGMSGDEYSYERPESIWELDGYLKVFLKYINSVPYLHIDSEVFLRVPYGIKGSDEVTDAIAPVTLVSLPFSEQRRVISKQLHYFDHPLFGMVVQIRRYRRPADPQSGED
ncbi:CsiV family protein [Alteromonas sp. KUL49]|uniref:CsiV family protein n=1 Tax=Alteromonas sp. KUL49 TaxID=2480798 RepID=UPI00102EFB86|nr:CsiV family protein [Alteromonas sp. KUL49]TAP40209.1 hypothetical protein EYS00_08535 [Alteromonas sp. KUL49]GEA11338.1 hypothetical protein KUL49_17130 [Alteromonas sp. KUL49]